MIELTRLQNQKLVINADLIESIEETPDTVITLTSGKKVMVKESVTDVVQKVIDYKLRCSLIPGQNQAYPPRG